MSLLSLVGLLLLRVFSREGVLLVFGAGTCKSSVFVWVGLTGGLGVSWVLFEVPAVLVGFGWSIMVVVFVLVVFVWLWAFRVGFWVLEGSW